MPKQAELGSIPLTQNFQFSLRVGLAVIQGLSTNWIRTKKRASQLSHGIMHNLHEWAYGDHSHRDMQSHLFLFWLFQNKKREAECRIKIFVAPFL